MVGSWVGSRLLRTVGQPVWPEPGSGRGREFTWGDRESEHGASKSLLKFEVGLKVVPMDVVRPSSQHPLGFGSLMALNSTSVVDRWPPPSEGLGLLWGCWGRGLIHPGFGLMDFFSPSVCRSLLDFFPVKVITKWHRGESKGWCCQELIIQSFHTGRWSLCAPNASHVSTPSVHSDSVGSEVEFPFYRYRNPGTTIWKTWPGFPCLVRLDESSNPDRWVPKLLLSVMTLLMVTFRGSADVSFPTWVSKSEVYSNAIFFPNNCCTEMPPKVEMYALVPLF